MYILTALSPESAARQETTPFDLIVQDQGTRIIKIIYPATPCIAAQQQHVLNHCMHGYRGAPTTTYIQTIIKGYRQQSNGYTVTYWPIPAYPK